MSETSTKLPRIAVVHPHLSPAGGSEARALHIVAALENDYDVVLITMGKPDIEILNEYYGTNLSKESFHVHSLSFPPFVKNFYGLRTYPLFRYCKKNASNFDLIISTYNVMDFGRKGIQFIADFSFDESMRRKLFGQDISRKKIFRHSLLLRKAYCLILNKLNKSTPEGWKQNLTVANSDWTSQMMKTHYKTESIKIYPPVSGKYPFVPWEGKENGFVFLGRISREKGIEIIIETINKVRLRGFDIHLHIVGDSDDFNYIAEIREMCETHKKWASFIGPLVGREKTLFLAKHRYGISACRFEAFGISVAEMSKAGCLVWVPNGGGQTEIVNHPDLIYSGIDDAVNKICRILEDNQKQCILLDHVKKSICRFSDIQFRNDIQSMVSAFLRDAASDN